MRRARLLGRGPSNIYHCMARAINGEKGELTLAQGLHCRVGYFTDGLVLGSKEFVDEIFQQGATDAAGCTETAALVHEETGKVLHHVQQFTLLVEYHKRASGGDVLEGNAAAEFRRWNRKTCGPRDLYRLAVSRTAGFQHLL